LGAVEGVNGRNAPGGVLSNQKWKGQLDQARRKMATLRWGGAKGRLAIKGSGLTATEECWGKKPNQKRRRFVGGGEYEGEPQPCGR